MYVLEHNDWESSMSRFGSVSVVLLRLGCWIGSRPNNSNNSFWRERAGSVRFPDRDERPGADKLPTRAALDRLSLWLWIVMALSFVQLFLSLLQLVSFGLFLPCRISCDGHWFTLHPLLLLLLHLWSLTPRSPHRRFMSWLEMKKRISYGVTLDRICLISTSWTCHLNIWIRIRYRILNIRTRIRTDLNPFKWIRSWIRSENIRTIFIPTYHPISLLCAEGFSAILQEVEVDGEIGGLKFGTALQASLTCCSPWFFDLDSSERGRCNKVTGCPGFVWVFGANNQQG